MWAYFYLVSPPGRYLPNGRVRPAASFVFQYAVDLGYQGRTHPHLLLDTRARAEFVVLLRNTTHNGPAGGPQQRGFAPVRGGRAPSTPTSTAYNPLGVEIRAVAF